MPGWTDCPVITPIKVTVSNTAMGSLLPDSNSSRAPTRPFRPTPRLRRTAKTAAASVEETMAPRSSPSNSEISRRAWAKSPTSRAVRATPSVASRAAERTTQRTLRHSVSRPPEKRM